MNINRNNVFLNGHRIFKITLAGNEFLQSRDDVVSKFALRLQFCFENTRFAVSIAN